MKWFGLLLAVSLFSGCGSFKEPKDGKDGESIVGPRGPAGAPGEDAQATVEPCLAVEVEAGYEVTCGDQTFTVTNGQDGEAVQGEAGQSCSVIDMDNGARIECEDGTVAFVADGEASTPDTIIEATTTCTGKHDISQTAWRDFKLVVSQTVYDTVHVYGEQRYSYTNSEGDTINGNPTWTERNYYELDQVDENQILVFAGYVFTFDLDDRTARLKKAGNQPVDIALNCN